MTPNEAELLRGEVGAPSAEAEILREGHDLDADEGQWLHDAAGRLRRHFREALYGPYAQQEDEEPPARPSWPGGR